HGGASRRPAPHVPGYLRERPPRRCGRVRPRTRGATGSEAVPVTAAPAEGPGPLRRIGAAARRADAATPPGRERAVDGLRGAAVCGVVLGHWLVSATVLWGGGGLPIPSPLPALPEPARAGRS